MRNRAIRFAALALAAILCACDPGDGPAWGDGDAEGECSYCAGGMGPEYEDAEAEHTWGIEFTTGAPVVVGNYHEGTTSWVSSFGVRCVREL